MIVIGSHALALLGHTPPGAVKDIDLIGVEADVERFRVLHADIIERERAEHGHRHVFYLKDAQPVERVEIDFEQSASDRMMADLCQAEATVMGLPVQLPPVEMLFLIRRAHANGPVHYAKGIRDILRLKPLTGPFSEAQMAFYRTRKQECQERYSLHRQRFSLAISNEDFFNTSNHIRFYEHDDLHEVIAHTPGEPLYKKCKYDLTRAKIDVDLFETLDPRDRLRMVQEEFMVIGLERYFLHDRTLTPPQVYSRGMHKTIRDLFVGYFQDFCIDHIDELITPPAFDFVARFAEAERAGKVRQVEIRIDPPNDTHKRVWALIEQGELNDARRISEDLIRRADHGIDSHAFFLLGATLFKSRDLLQAEKFLRQCVMRDRNHKLAWFYLGTTLRKAGRPAEAVQALARAARAGFRPVGLYWNLGLAFEALAKPDHAIAAFRRAHALKQGDPKLAKKLEELGAAAA